MRSAILFARGDERQFYVAPTVAAIAEYLDFESAHDLSKDPSFVGMFKEDVAVINVATMTVTEMKWTRVV